MTSDAESIARAQGVLRYVVEHGPSDLSKAVLDHARRVAARELYELGGAADIPHYEPDDPRLDAETLRQVSITLNKLEERVGPEDARILQAAADALHELQADLEVAQEARFNE